MALFPFLLRHFFSHSLFLTLSPISDTNMRATWYSFSALHQESNKPKVCVCLCVCVCVCVCVYMCGYTWALSPGVRVKLFTTTTVSLSAQGREHSFAVLLWSTSRIKVTQSDKLERTILIPKGLFDTGGLGQQSSHDVQFFLKRLMYYDT